MFPTTKVLCNPRRTTNSAQQDCVCDLTDFQGLLRQNSALPIYGDTADISIFVLQSETTYLLEGI